MKRRSGSAGALLAVITHDRYDPVTGVAAVCQRFDKFPGDAVRADQGDARQAHVETEQFGADEPGDVTEQYQEYEAEHEAVDRHQFGREDGRDADEVPKDHEQHAHEGAGQQPAEFAEALFVDVAVVQPQQREYEDPEGQQRQKNVEVGVAADGVRTGVLLSARSRNAPTNAATSAKKSPTTKKKLYTSDALDFIYTKIVSSYEDIHLEYEACESPYGRGFGVGAVPGVPDRVGFGTRRTLYGAAAVGRCGAVDRGGDVLLLAGP